MLVKEKLRKEGDFFFRHRTHIPFALIPLFIIGLAEMYYPIYPLVNTFVWDLICLAMSFFGFLGRVWVVGYAPKNTSGRNTKRQKADLLNITGAYSLSRNPLYFFNIVIILGFALFCKSLLVFSLVWVISYVFYERIIYVEECFLEKKFGQAYHDWVSKTSMLWPRKRAYQPPQTTFQWKRVLRKEFPGLMVIGMTFFALDFLENMMTAQNARLDPFWSYFVLVIFVIWLTLRTLKKHTPFLKDSNDC